MSCGTDNVYCGWTVHCIPVLEAIMTLLLQPNPDDALVGSIAEVYNTNRAKFEKTAKEYVKKYAQP